MTRFITRTKDPVVGRGDLARLVQLAETLAGLAGEAGSIYLNAGGPEVAIEAGHRTSRPLDRSQSPPAHLERIDYTRIPSSSQALRQLVMRVADRAGITEHIHPHDLRHAFADHIARLAGAQIAQHMLGHAHLGTTHTYLGTPLIDEMVLAVSNISYETRTRVPGVSESLQKAQEATTGIEPV